MNISNTTTLTLPLIALATAIFILIGAVWRAANFLRDIKAELKEIRLGLRTTVKQNDFKDWAHQLERENREVKTGVSGKQGLFVPDFRPDETFPLE